MLTDNMQIELACGIALAGYKECLIQSLAVDTELPVVGGSVEERITDVLFGSRKIRAGNTPSRDQKEYMVELISRYVRVNQPIELLVMWGALKGYALFEDRQEADLLDLLGIRRLAGLAAKVKKVYPQGIKARILQEDITEFVLSDNWPDLQPKMLKYRNTLRNLIDVFGLSDVILLQRESEVLQNRKVPVGEVVVRAKTNGVFLREYWESLRMTGQYYSENVPELRRLKKMGWSGVVPEVMWNYYLDRAKTEHPDWSVEDLAQSVCDYLGNSLARKQYRVIEGMTRDDVGVIPPVKASLVSHPPGVSQEMFKGRIEYKLKDSKNSNNSTPPWAGFGTMVSKAEGMYDVHVLPVKEMNRRSEDFIQATFKLSNWVPLGDFQALAQVTAEVRADLYRGASQYLTNTVASSTISAWA